MRYENDFTNSLMNLQRGLNNKIIWSEILVSFYENHSFDDVPFYQSQLLDASTIFELSLETGIDKEKIEYFQYETDSENIKTIKWLLENIEYVTPVQKLNLSSLLASMVRYNLSLEILDKIEYEKLLPREKGYYWIQRFFVMERLDLKENFDLEFEEIKKIVESNVYSKSAEMVFICQAIAFFVKSDIISESLFNFFVKRGIENAQILSDYSNRDINANLALSNFYRAYAMTFMYEDYLSVKECMDKCYYYANSIESNNRFVELKKIEALKTFHESSLKAELYLSKDFEQALQHSKEMFKLDSNWSIFKREIALVFEKLKNFQMSAQWMERSTEYYSPLFISNMFEHALILEKIDNEKAIEKYREILTKDKLNYSSAIRGYIVSDNSDCKEYFKKFLDDYVDNDYITKNEIEEDITNEYKIRN